MADPNTNDLIDASKCIDLCIPDGMKLAVLIKVLAQNAGVSTDPQSLISGTECINSCVPIGMQGPIIIKLLNTIAESGGSGSCENLEGATANPNGSITPEFVGQVYVTTGHIWQAASLLNNSWVDITPSGTCASASGAGSPSGSVTPQFSSQLYHDTTNSKWYLALSTTNTSWVLIGDGDAANPNNFYLPFAKTLTSAISLGGFTLTGFFVPQLINTGGFDIDVANNGITNFNFGSLVNAAYLGLGGNSAASFSFPALVSTTNSIAIDGTPATSISFPVLTTVGAAGLTLSISSLSITALSLPAFVTGNIYAASNSSLVSVSIPSKNYAQNSDLIFSGCALPSAQVNALLHAARIGGQTGGTIDVAGGTNGAPTGAGIADKAFLILAGVTVNTN